MRLKDILETTRPAEDFADAIGLEAEGDGMWSDPHTGKVTHRIDHGRLTKVDPDGPSETNRLLRKLMKLSLIQLLLGESLTEEESEASKEAKAKGFDYKGFGRWTDPNTGQRYTSQNGRLVAVDPNQTSMNLGDPKVEPRKGEPGAMRDRRGQAAKGPRAYQDTKKSKYAADPNQTSMNLKGDPNFTRDTGPGESPSGQEANKQRIDSFLDKVSTVKNKDKAANLIHNKIQHIEKQWTGVFDTTPKDPMYKNYGEADFEDDLYNLEKGYKKIVGKPYKAKDFADKPKSKYDDPKYKKGDWWDDPDFDQKMMAKTAADRAAKKADKDAEFKKDNEKWAGDRAKGAKLKRAQELRQSWKQKGHAEDQATYARDFPRLYALDVVTQQGKDLSADIAKGMKGPKGKDPQWRKDAAEEIRRHRERVEKIREMPQDTETSDEEGMDARRAMFDHLRQDGDDTVSGMKGKAPRIVRRQL